MVESDKPCPKCGDYQWWRDNIFPNKSGKTVTIISHCSSCGSVFRQIKRLIYLNKRGKIIKS